MNRYQVVGDCAHVMMDTPAGPTSVLLYKPAMLPPNVSAERIKHLLSVGLIAKVGDGPVPEDSVPDDGDPAASGADGGEGTKVDDAEAEAARAAARAELPTDGSAPKKNASQQVWAEYAASKGYDFAEASKQTRDDLIALTR